MFTGVRCLEASTDADGPSSDQLVAEAIGAGTIHKVLALRVQAAIYIGNSGVRGRMSYRRDSAGVVRPVEPVTSPRQLFSSLFSNFTADSEEARLEQERQLRQRKSVLDLVDRDVSQRLLNRLGGADRVRIAQHLQELRDLERKVAAIPPAQQMGCTLPADPGPDASVAGDVRVDGETASPSTPRTAATAARRSGPRRWSTCCTWPSSAT
jgi:hypothetical protein